MELRHLRYFVAVGEEEHFGRGAERLRVAQPALSRQIQALERDLGFPLFDRLPRGVRLTAAGRSFLDEARRILESVEAAAERARRIASGLSGTLRIGFVESMSWHGFVPDALRLFRELHEDAELRIEPLSSRDQIEAVRTGALDAGFVFVLSEVERDLARLEIASVDLILAVPRGHALARVGALQLRDLRRAPFVWFPRRESPAFYDRLMRACSRGGLESPRVVQEGVNEATILSLVSCGLGVAFVSGATRWRCPEGVVLRPVPDLQLPLPFALVWRKDETSPLLAKFVAGVRSLPDVAPSER